MAGLSGPIYPFKANQISVYKTDLRNSKYTNLSSTTVHQNMNNLVYIGVNSKWAGSVASIDWVRQAMNIGISRTEIAAASFLGQTTPAITPFKDDFYQLKKDDLPSAQGELQKAVSLLERNGYTKINAEGIRTNGSSALRVNILVCTENQYKLSVAEAVKASLQDLGFGVTITEKKTAEAFVAALKEGHFTLYIGETELPLNYDLTEFFSADGVLSYGIDTEFFKEYQAYKNGEGSTMTFVESFETEVPFIPLFYRKAIVSVNPNIVGFMPGESYATVSNWKVIK
jgi:ABC-type transport system substrate-binding protein